MVQRGGQCSGPTWRAEPVIGGGEWIGADADSIAEAGDGYPADAMGGEEEGHVWEEWDSTDWVEGTGIDRDSRPRTGAGWGRGGSGCCS